MKLLKLTFLFITLLFYSSSAQLKKNRTPHPFSGKVVFSSEFGFTHSYTDYLYSVPKLLSRGTIEFYLPVRSHNALGIKVFSGLGSLASYGRNDLEKFSNPNFNTSMFILGTGFIYAGRLGYSIPYISANISHLRINPQNAQGQLLPFNAKRKYDLNLTMYTVELGLRFLVKDFWSVNLGVNWNVTNSDFVDDLKMNEQNDKFVTLFGGISFYYSGSKYNDTDKDGVIDCKDVCPGTPKGVEVDEFGCAKNSKLNKHKPLPGKKIGQKKTIDSTRVAKIDIQKDSDKDGVPDYLDKCPDTPPATKVDVNGCKKIINSKKIIPKKKPKFKKIKHTYQYTKEKALPELFFTDGNLFCFQVASFKSFNEAKKLKNKLNKSGHHSFIVKVINSNNGKALYKVRIGYFRTLQSAKNYKKKFKF